MSQTQQSQVEQPIGRLFSSLGKGYLSLLRTKLQHLDIDRNYFALVLIESYNGEISQQELAILLETDKVSIVRIVDYLSEKGFVKRVRKMNDRRKCNLVLTEKAKAAIPEIKKSFTEMNETALFGFSSKQSEELAQFLVKIDNNLTGNIESI
jgi:MarR family transcriptional regulator, transcriptional regulator for hemolysin